MAKMNPLLPGKLGNPELSLGSDPRLDPRLVTLFNQGEAMDEMLEESDTVNAGSSYEEAVAYIGLLEENMHPFYEALFADIKPVTDVTRRTQTIIDADDHEITLYIHEPSNRNGASTWHRAHARGRHGDVYGRRHTLCPVARRVSRERPLRCRGGIQKWRGQVG